MDYTEYAPRPPLSSVQRELRIAREPEPSYAVANASTSRTGYNASTLRLPLSSVQRDGQKAQESPDVVSTASTSAGTRSNPPTFRFPFSSGQRDGRNAQESPTAGYNASAWGRGSLVPTGLADSLGLRSSPKQGGFADDDRWGSFTKPKVGPDSGDESYSPGLGDMTYATGGYSNIHEFYMMGDLIGNGEYGSVHEAQGTTGTLMQSRRSAKLQERLSPKFEARLHL